MKRRLSDDAKELLDQIGETCQEANDNLEGAELKAFSLELQALVERWRTAWRTGGDE